MAFETPYKLYKTLTGKIQVKYGCPGCGLELENSLNEAGRTDTCPGCKKNYVVPGEMKKIEIEQQQAKEEENKRQESIKKQSAAKEVKQKHVSATANERILTEQDRKEYSYTRTRVRSHLTTIRSHSCYPSLRILINVCFWILLVAISVVSFMSVVASFSFDQEYQTQGIFVWVMVVIPLIFALSVVREAALLLIDIADTLLFEHSKDR